MIYQLPNGRIIEISIDTFLDLSDDELRDLNSLGNEFSSEIQDPFYKSSLAKGYQAFEEDSLLETEEKELSLDEITDEDKLLDQDYLRDDV